MKLSLSLALGSIIMASAASQSLEAPAGFDSKSNGTVDDVTHQQAANF